MVVGNHRIVETQHYHLIDVGLRKASTQPRIKSVVEKRDNAIALRFLSLISFSAFNLHNLRQGQDTRTKFFLQGQHCTKFGIKFC
ncbi:hypothetical protein CK510_12555 [Brunnivagina elsteri CCALA 953]|uniref:Uncharacterized protein n=1 Tax=Brunnivagina elsteri CCALA 953 TaxID=987040 RepID=A0A2A2TJ89_9CYAN|nr:hypothetical protein CK510_12555 [Calothrix elsteri CCALA 953]